MKIYDISEPISPATAVFPGDTPFSVEWLTRIEQGASCNVSAITMSVHCGTHTDSPQHFDSRGADIASVDLTAYMGRCRVMEVTGSGKLSLISAAALDAAALAGVERILFKTKAEHDHTVFDINFTSVGPEAAHFLAKSGVRLVGIDTPSIDHAVSKGMKAHHALQENGVAILENLDLSQVPPGDYELIALPLKIVGGDSSPVRAILRDLVG